MSTDVNLTASPDEPVQAPNPYFVVRMSGTDKTAPAFPELKVLKGPGWVQYGAKNLFPQEVLAISGKSPVNDAIIKSTVTFAAGRGVSGSATDEKSSTYIGTPNTSQTWEKVVGPLLTDRKTFGGMYLQVIVNRGSTTVSLFHQDFSEVRVGLVDEYGAPLTFRVSKDWKKTTGKNKPIELEVWPGINKAKKGVAYMAYFWKYSPGLSQYCVPDWWAAESYVKADGKLGPFYNNSIDNNFTPSVAFAFPSNPSQPEKDKIQEQIEDNYAGVEAGSAIICLFGEGQNGGTPTVTPFDASKNAEVYLNVENQIFQKIVSAHRLSSPTLAGVSGGGNLSGNAAEIIDGFILFNYTSVEEIRRDVLEMLNAFTKINKTAALVIDDLEVVQKINEAKNGDKTININNNGGEGQDSLAKQIGVGGVAALTAIMSGALPDDQKRGLLASVFGLSEKEIDTIFNDNKKTTRLQRVLNSLKLWK